MPHIKWIKTSRYETPVTEQLISFSNWQMCTWPSSPWRGPQPSWRLCGRRSSLKSSTIRHHFEKCSSKSVSPTVFVGTLLTVIMLVRSDTGRSAAREPRDNGKPWGVYPEGRFMDLHAGRVASIGQKRRGDAPTHRTAAARQRDCSKFNLWAIKW